MEVVARPGHLAHADDLNRHGGTRLGDLVALVVGHGPDAAHRHAGDDYIALLDESLTTLNKSGLFGEIGSNRQGSAGTTQTIGIKAQELQKAAADGLSSPDAIIKAFEENPELAAQYEAEYMGR